MSSNYSATKIAMHLQTHQRLGSSCGSAKKRTNSTIRLAPFTHGVYGVASVRQICALAGLATGPVLMPQAAVSLRSHAKDVTPRTGFTWTLCIGR